MSIAPVLQVVIVGAAARRDGVLAALQREGFVHVEGLPEAARRAARSGAAGGERARLALRYLAATPRIRAQAPADTDFSVEAFVEAVLANRERRRTLHDQRDELDRRIAQVTPWGDFTLPETPDAVGGRLWFYQVPVRALPRLASLALPWRVVHRADGHAFVVVVSAAEPPADAIPAPRVRMGARSLRSLQAARDALELRIDEADLEREALSRRLGLLARDLALAEDRGMLAVAGTLAQAEEGLFVLRGWAPAKQAQALETLAQREGFAALTAPPGPEEDPPTLLAPAAPVAAGADIARLYKLPAMRDWDPSGVLYFSFAAFFALILSDAGYAAVLAAGTLLAWPGLGAQPLGRRLRGLALAASLFALAWGVAVGSYFGAGPPHPALAGLQIARLDDYDAMMTLSVSIGAGHIALANLAAAWAARWRREALGPLGWAGIVAGAMALWRGGAPLQPFAIALLGLSAALIAVGAGGPVRAALAFTNITKLFADVLSYLRLFALGLASASLAIAFNDLAAKAYHGAGGFGLVAAGLILLAGHALNLILAVAGGLVHGLRLNVIEFFNWGLAGEGRAFTPFIRQVKEER